MKSTILLIVGYIIIITIVLSLSSCSSTRGGYENVTKDYIGYGTYKAPNKKGLDR